MRIDDLHRQHAVQKRTEKGAQLLARHFVNNCKQENQRGEIERHSHQTTRAKDELESGRPHILHPKRMRSSPQLVEHFRHGPEVVVERAFEIGMRRSQLASE